MRAIICSTRGIAPLVHRSRANHLAVACFQRASHSTFSYQSNCTDETVSLPIGNNGAISLRITRPSALNLASQGRLERPNVIMYLPPGPLFPQLDSNIEQKDDPSSPDTLGQANGHAAPLTSTGLSPQHVLASTTSAVVVTVNYRLGEAKKKIYSSDEASQIPEEPDGLSDQTADSTSPQPLSYKYPTPVHDTLAGFDWIHKNLNPSKLGVFGTHIGGSLALMLALTEARSIKAVAALDPVCDWPILDEYCTRDSAVVKIPDNVDGSTPAPKTKRQRRKAAPSDLVPLLEARSRFFATPERCFDSFASPILFLRSAGRDVPRAFPRYLTGPEYPVPVLRETPSKAKAADDESIWDLDEYPDADGEDVDEFAATATRRRKALSRWPPYGLDYGLSGDNWSGPDEGIGRLEVTLPWVKVFARSGNSSGVDGEVSRKPVVKAKEGSVGSTVLARQADEMVSVMRRACFWGREKGFAERKVTLSKVDDFSDSEAGNWLHEAFQGSLDDSD